MDSEVKILLEKNLKLTEENNKLLVKLHDFQKWNFISRIIYWFILIGIAVGAFYFIKPFMEGILGGSSFNPVNSIDMLGDLIK